MQSSDSMHSGRSYRLGHQSWTASNLYIHSYHDEIAYFTTRWDALCPYIDVNEAMLRIAPQPLLIYALPPESDWGHPIRDAYGLVTVRQPGYWHESRRARKFKELRQKHRHFEHTVQCIPGAMLSADEVYDWGGEHFQRFDIDPAEVDGFLDYVNELEVLVFQVLTKDGDLVLTDVSMILPERSQVYGSFCQWNPRYRNYSPGLYACLLAAQWTYDQGYEYYNLGPVGDFPYKRLFVNQVEPIFSLALCPSDHPLMLDQSSPLHTDFCAADWNRLERNPNRIWNAADFLLPAL
jgi:hypothetical protein